MTDTAAATGADAADDVEDVVLPGEGSGVRRAVKDEVTRRTGLTVDHVDLEVVSLTVPATRGASRVT